MNKMNNKKLNVFGWPIFKGKLLLAEDSSKVFSMKCVGNVCITFKNDLSAIKVSDKKYEKVEGFTNELDLENDVACSLLNLAAIACGIKPPDVTEEQAKDFMMYLATGSSDTSCISSLKYNLETESVTVNGFGFYVK